MRECRYCGNLFQEENGHQVFCSDYCRREQRNKAKRIKRANKPKEFAPIRSHTGIKDIDYIQRRINTKTDKIIYLGGYVNDNSNIYVQCKDCGSIYAKTTRCLRPSGHKNIQCEYCRSILSNIHERERKLRLQEESRIRSELRKREKDERAKLLEESYQIKKICKHCGKPFVTHKLNKLYCSSQCAKRQLNSNHSTRRRIRKNGNGAYSNDISLELLYKRDNGKCWICGKQTDWNDKTIRSDGICITGNNYPTQDHIIPLAKGGTHTWDNIRLAHRNCNSSKGDKLMMQGKNSQMVFVI